MATPARHPYAATLELMRLAIFKLPPTFPREKRRAYEKKLQQFLEKPKAKYDDIQATIVALGKESWTLRKAYEEVYARYGQWSEEAFLLHNLDEHVRDKYRTFIREGGKLNYVARVRTEEQLRQPSPFEKYFSPQEKFAIEQALLLARDQARAEIDGLVTGAKRDEYEAIAEDLATRQKEMEECIEELRGLASVSAKWEPAISDRVRVLEESWSAVEQGADLHDLRQELDYWKGTLAAFLHAA